MSRSDPIEFIEWIIQKIHYDEHNSKTSWKKCKEEICVTTKIWLEDFRNEEKIWVTADHKILLIKDMEDAHLYNAYNHLKKKASQLIFKNKIKGLKPSDIIATNFPVINDLKAEIVKRQNQKESKELKQYKNTRNLDI